MPHDKIYRRGLKHSSLRQGKWERKIKPIAQTQGPVGNNLGSLEQEMTLSWASVCMSGQIRSLSGAPHQLYKMIMCERSAARLWTPEAMLQALQPQKHLPLSCNTMFLLSPLNVLEKWHQAEVENLAANQGRFSSPASGEAQGCDTTALPTRCQAASAPARCSCVSGVRGNSCHALVKKRFWHQL